MEPIYCGRKATKLSEIIEQRDDGYGYHYWVVADVSGNIPSRVEAYTLAREWYPELEDDEGE